MFYRVFSNGANVIINDINLAVNASNPTGVLVKQEEFEGSQQAQRLLMANLIRIEPVESLTSALASQAKFVETKAPVTTSSAYIVDHNAGEKQKDEAPVFVRQVPVDDPVDSTEADTSTEVESVIETAGVELVEPKSEVETEVQVKKEVKQNKNKKGK